MSKQNVTKQTEPGQADEQGLIAELMSQVSQLRSALEGLGVSFPGRAEPDRGRAYVEFGSPEHAIFLGLIVLDEKDDPLPGRILYTSPKTGTRYHLEDQVTPFMHYPDPTQVAALVLEQKATEFEAGPPEVPATALPMWRPGPGYP